MKPIKYSGPMVESSGYAQANRNIVQSLHESGVQVTTEIQVFANHPADYGKQGELCKSLQGKYDDYQIKVLHITPNIYPKYKEVGKYHVGHLFWETTGMNPTWSWYLDEVREIWTGCQYNKRCFQDVGFTGSITVMPQPVMFDNDPQNIPIEGVKDTDFVFYSIFQWIERKDPRTLLEAYWEAFRGVKDVVLILKTYGLAFGGRQEQIIYDQITTWKKKMPFQDLPRVLVIDSLLSHRQIQALHTRGDCFVSSHRGEGWGEPQGEALSYKNPVISTDLGGIHEWIDSSGMYKLQYTMVDVFGMDWAEQYSGGGQKWGQADKKKLIDLMRYVYENKEEAKRVGESGYRQAKEKLAPPIVGEMMKKRIMEIEAGLNG